RGGPFHLAGVGRGFCEGGRSRDRGRGRGRRSEDGLRAVARRRRADHDWEGRDPPRAAHRAALRPWRDRPRTRSEMTTQGRAAALRKVPVTILTGFLGAGKTTLLNRILRERHGERIAVIENEFGEEGVDNDLIIDSGAEQLIEMNNGCICCTVRGDL